jgi:hypothetical protein
MRLTDTASDSARPPAQNQPQREKTRSLKKASQQEKANQKTAMAAAFANLKG